MANAFQVTINSTVMPDDITDVSRSDELLWSEGTGRSATTGAMSGSVVAKKQTYTIQWGVITAAEYTTIRNAVGGGFMPLKIEVNGATLANITVYRGNISGSLLGVFGGVAYYKDVSVELVER